MKSISFASVIAGSLALAGLFAFAGCRPVDPHLHQGYLEGEFIYVASPGAGRLEHLQVNRGDRVEPGRALFSLDATPEQATQAQAHAARDAAEARLADLKKGVRPSELAVLEASLAQSRSAAELSALTLARQEKLVHADASTQEEYDRARLTHQENLKAIDSFSAQIETARLGGRTDVVAAAEADVASAVAAVRSADWAAAQKKQAATVPALVYDTLFREGEFVTAGAPVVVLLPPENLKVRFFVSEEAFAAFKAGDVVKVRVTGHPELTARITYLSPQPEYTPPVLYNRENRAKLVFRIEARFTDDAVARDLHPGQPVDVIN